MSDSLTEVHYEMHFDTSDPLAPVVVGRDSRKLCVLSNQEKIVTVYEHVGEFWEEYATINLRDTPPTIVFGGLEGQEGGAKKLNDWFFLDRRSNLSSSKVSEAQGVVSLRRVCIDGETYSWVSRSMEVFDVGTVTTERCLWADKTSAGCSSEDWQNHYEDQHREHHHPEGDSASP
jgi:hypothetical protein